LRPQGCSLATSVGGVLTGRGADIIIDDLLKPEEASPQSARQAANDWFTTPSTVGSRQSDGRHHPDHAPAAGKPDLGPDPRDDLADHVLAQED